MSLQSTPVHSGPRFINPGDHPVNVRDPQGHQRVVRPFRELTAFSWRTEDDCVCVGEHYASFPGILVPFPEPEQKPAPAAQADPAAAAGADVGLQAGAGRYKATGDVLSPDGTIKKDGDAASAADAPGAGDPAADPAEGRDESEGGADPDAPESQDDIQQDRPLEDVPGVSRALAKQLRAAGYDSAFALANVQDEKALAKLGKVKGVKDAEALVDAAQTLLGWEEVSDDNS
jgi:hypothetical protein